MVDARPIEPPIGGKTRPASIDGTIAALADAQYGVVSRAQLLVVELDGRAAHGTAAAFERDRARDRRLHAAGWRAVRITWHQLQADPKALADDLRAVLGRPHV